MDGQAKEGMLDVSIHHLYHPTTRNLIMVACAGVAMLTPFTDTIYLPALSAVADAFDTTDSMVSLTVSIYLASVGVGQLMWGPLSDYYGRTRVLYVALLLYEAFTIGCIFCSNITQLIILRSIEGFVVGSTIVSAQSIIADVFAPDERGTAMGAFLVFLSPFPLPSHDPHFLYSLGSYAAGTSGCPDCRRCIGRIVWLAFHLCLPGHIKPPHSPVAGLCSPGNTPLVGIAKS